MEFVTTLILVVPLSNNIFPSCSIILQSIALYSSIIPRKEYRIVILLLDLENIGLDFRYRNHPHSNLVLRLSKRDFQSRTPQLAACWDVVLEQSGVTMRVVVARALDVVIETQPSERTQRCVFASMSLPGSIGSFCTGHGIRVGPRRSCLE